MWVFFKRTLIANRVRIDFRRKACLILSVHVDMSGRSRAYGEKLDLEQIRSLFKQNKEFLIPEMDYNRYQGNGLV